MKLSDIQLDDKIPIDNKFGDIFRKVMQKEIPVYVAIIKLEDIKPFSKYKPETSNAMSIEILNNIKSGNYPRLHVYQEGEFFIMSDDYHSYHAYHELNYDEAVCIVMGDEPTGKYVVEKGDADYSYSMYFKVIEEPEKN